VNEAAEDVTGSDEALTMPTVIQPAILAPVPAHGRFLVGLGAPLVGIAAGHGVPGLRPFPALAAAGCSFPSTQGALFVFLGGDDPGEVLQRASALERSLGAVFCIDEEVHAFRYAGGRDLSGYEDGTENPKGDAAVRAAIVEGKGPGLDGGSFVAVQRWVHDLRCLTSLPQAEQDARVGRSRVTNDELPDAPTSAHVKRAAQESFDPPAFMVRRSMPYGDVHEQGLVFVAYGATLDAYERVLRRMAGLEDGVADGLLTFTRAVSGGYYFCPPLRDGALDLTAI
jgi:putative iron-dependent peroxidase